MDSVPPVPLADASPPAPASSECPAGSAARGEPPPAGRETWCEDPRGRRQGPWQIWDAQGQLIGRVSYRDDRPHGPTSLLFADGTPAETGQHEHGRRVGRWTSFDADGSPRLQTDYEADDLVVERVFEPDGQLVAQWSHQGGLRHGTWIDRDEDGALVRREVYEHGTLVQAFEVRDGEEVEVPTDGMQFSVDLSPARCPEELATAEPTARREQALVVLVLDRSGSMSGERFEAVRTAVLRIGEVIASDTRLAVVMYDSGPTLVADSADPSTSLADAMATVTVGGGTDLQPALELAAGLVQQHARGRSRVVVMTDGMFPVTCIDAWIRRLRLQGAIVDVAAIGEVEVPDLERIAGFGGGRLRLSEAPSELTTDLVELATSAPSR